MRPTATSPRPARSSRPAAKTGLAPARIFERCGLLEDSHDYHLKRFLHEFFPRGTAFPAHELPPLPGDLPRAAAQAFSLDDVGTTEIDDAFSIQKTKDGLRVGIHIAAPALGFAPGSPLDALARERLSTAYMPGRKFTMLPEDVIARFSLDHGGELPVVSLYVDLDENYAPRGRHSRLERVPIVANLRHAQYDVLNEGFEKGESKNLAHEDDLRVLWRAALALEARRGKPSARLRAGLQLLRRRRPRAHRAAQARRAARQAGFRDDDPRQFGLGRAPGRARCGRHLPRAIDRKSALQRASRAARGPGRRRLRLDELAAAALCRPGEPVAARRRAGRAQAAVCAQLRRAARGFARLRGHGHALR